jgi:thioredoxin-related protein
MNVNLNACRKKGIGIILALLPLFGISQETGIQFEHNLSWQQVLQKARTENKYILVDCYTTWCGPCKLMSTEIFPLKEVRDFINKRFISVSLQLDTSSRDNDTVKAWYSDAHKMVDQYQINTFPTYLFFAPDGHIVHRAWGASQDPDSFIAKAANALDEPTQYYTLLDAYRQGGKDSAMLRQLAFEAQGIGDEDTTRLVALAYLVSVTNLYNKDNLVFMGKVNPDAQSRGFDLWLHHGQKVDSIMGADYAERKVMNAVMLENKLPPIKPDWVKVYRDIKVSYGPYYADRITKWVKMAYYHNTKQWTAYASSLVSYTGTYASTMQPGQLNSLAWDVVTYSSDRKELEAALSWSKSTLTSKEAAVYNYYDTFANLLYKLDRKTGAVAMEQKALALAPEREKPGFDRTLGKMRNGKKIGAE